MFWKKFRIRLAAALGVLILIVSLGISSGIVLAATSFTGGNIFLVSNTNAPAWTDPVNANVGDIVEFHLELVNSGSETAKNVKVHVDLPTGISGNTLTATIHIKADNAAEISDTASVVVSSSGTKNLVYFPGHATLIKHPGNINVPIEEIGTGAEVTLGDLDVGGNVFFEVLFKARVTEEPGITPTATPTPTVTVTPTITPTVTVTPTPTIVPAGNVVSCPAGFVETVSGSTIICLQQVQTQTANPSANASTGPISITTTGGSATSTTNVTQTVPVSAPAVTPAPSVTQLPKTGLPLAAWLLSGLFPAGIGLKRFGLGKKGQEMEEPYYLNRAREFLKE